MEATNAGIAQVVVGETQRSNVSNADWSLRDWKGFFEPPTAEEVSRLTLGNLRDFRFYAQEGRNHFAHLLNRGSSQE